MTVLFFDDIIAFKEMMYQQRFAETEKEMKRRKRVQKVDIVFNFVGEISIPSNPIFTPESVNKDTVCV